MNDMVDLDPDVAALGAALAGGAKGALHRSVQGLKQCQITRMLRESFHLRWEQRDITNEQRKEHLWMVLTSPATRYDTLFETHGLLALEQDGRVPAGALWKEINRVLAGVAHKPLAPLV